MTNAPEHAMNTIKLYVGLDVHKNSVVVAPAGSNGSAPDGAVQAAVGDRERQNGSGHVLPKLLDGKRAKSNQPSKRF